MNNLIHPKEITYKNIMYVFGGVIWLILFCFFLVSVVATLGLSLLIGLIYVSIFAFFSWIGSQYFKAQILGDSVKVTASQYPEIYNKVIEYCQNTQINNIPEVYVFNSNGLLNAFAVKIFMKKFVMLTSSIVDIAYKKENMDELNFIIGHELGHHAAGHTSILRSFIIGPAKIVPFLGAAYSRACELTADRYGMFLSNNLSASVNSLLNLAHGSRVLSPKTNIEAFVSQENEIPEIMGFISKIYASHPRLTRRVIELNSFAFQQNGQMPSYNFPVQNSFNNSNQQSYTNTLVNNSQHNVYATVQIKKNCSNCGNAFQSSDVFCENCGNKLK